MPHPSLALLSFPIPPSFSVPSPPVVQVELEYTTLRSVTEATEIWYDPDPTTTVIEEDIDTVASYFEMPDEGINLAAMSPWLLRIELNRAMMVDKQLTMEKIDERISKEFNRDMHCVYSDDNAPKLILRIRIVNEEAGKGGEEGMEEEASDDDVFLKQVGGAGVEEEGFGICV